MLADVSEDGLRAETSLKISCCHENHLMPLPVLAWKTLHIQPGQICGYVRVRRWHDEQQGIVLQYSNVNNNLRLFVIELRPRLIDGQSKSFS